MKYTPRSFEVPWVLRQVKAGSVLDIGTVHSKYAEELSERGHEVVGVDIRCSKMCYTAPYRFIFCNIRKLSEEDLGQFDNVLLISTLEHIGMKAYGQEREPLPNIVQRETLRHCLRFLKKGGKLLCTLPYGDFEDDGRQLIYDRQMIALLVKDLNLRNTVYFSFNFEKEIYEERQKESVSMSGEVEGKHSYLSGICLEFGGINES